MSNVALAHRDPPTCTTSTASVGIREFFSISGDPSSVVTRPKIVGETVYYQAAIGPISGSQCAISGGTLYICTPDEVTAGFDSSIASVVANCHNAGAVGNNCVGCTIPDPSLPGLVSVTEFDAPPGGSLIPYVVSLADENAACGTNQIRARAFLVGATVHSPTGNVTPANADVPACNEVQTCTIQVDKRVSCDSAQNFPPGSFHDVGFVTADDDNTTDFCASWNANNGMPAESIRVEYVVRNTGTANVSNCTGTESNSAITSSPLNIGDILAGSDSEPTDADNACSADLVVGEPDQFDVTCTCGAPADMTGLTASAFDRAKFECLNPGLNVVKQCDPAQLDHPSNFTITVTNSGADPAADLANCSITDQWFPADPVTQCTVVPANATIAATTPATILTLNGGDMATATGSFTSPVPGTICNNASVTCEIVGSIDQNGDPKTITASDTADCPVGTTSTTTSSSTSSTTSSTTTTTATTTTTTSSTLCPPVILLVRDHGKLGNGANLSGGFGANNPGGMIQLGKNSFTADGAFLIADTVNLLAGSNVFKVFANTVNAGPGVIIRAGTMTPTLPIQDPFCPIPSPIDCTGGQPVTVPRFSTQTLTPGTYGVVRVLNGGKLTLAGPGTFTFCAILTARNGDIEVTGGGQSTINISGDLRLANGGLFAPDASTQLPIINIAGSRVRIGAGAQIQAFLSAPNAELSIGRSGKLVGVFCVDTTRSDKNVNLMCPPLPTD